MKLEKLKKKLDERAAVIQSLKNTQKKVGYEWLFGGIATSNPKQKRKLRKRRKW